MQKRLRMKFWQNMIDSNSINSYHCLACLLPQYGVDFSSTYLWVRLRFISLSCDKILHPSAARTDKIAIDGTYDHDVVASTLSAKNGVLSHIYMVGALLAPLCVAFQGSRGQKADILSKVAEGKMQLSFALTEPDAGSDAGAAKTTAVLGGEECLEKAWGTFRKTGMLERLVVSFMAVGLAQAATARATQFVQERKQFGKYLKDFQSIQHTVVEMGTLTKGMQLFAENALQAQENESDPTQAISMAKYFNAEQLQKIMGMAVRVMGGRAFFDFEPISRYYRGAPFSLYAGGTIEVQKMLIARSIGI